jgi:hypothetical protein
LTTTAFSASLSHRRHSTILLSSAGYSSSFFIAHLTGQNATVSDSPS